LHAPRKQLSASSSGKSKSLMKMDVTDLMRQCNGKTPPNKALVKGLARELDINESFLEKLADEVRKDLGTK
jgi:hypothetical protein